MPGEAYFHSQNVIPLAMTAASKAAPLITDSDTVKRLTKIWQELLGVGSIGLHENYFDLGGDSSLAVQLFSRIASVFKVQLPLATLFDAPTIAELAEVLHREVSAPQWSPLVAIQPSGSRPPFFCMHGAGGNVLIYRDLSRYLGADQPFYGLQSQGLDGTSLPLGTIEEMAALYVNEIRKVSPHGPYFLGGYCMGGTVAYEVAQQLCAQGEEIGLLALFDTMNWSNRRPVSAFDRTYHILQRFLFHAANFLCLEYRGMSKFVWEKIATVRNRLPVWLGILLAKLDKHPSGSKSESRVLGDIWRTNDHACVKYVPRPYRGAVTDFRPIKQYRIYNRADVKWDRLARAQEIIVLPVYPAGMLAEPFVKNLAAVLRNSIDKAALARQS